VRESDETTGRTLFCKACPWDGRQIESRPANPGLPFFHPPEATIPGPRWAWQQATKARAANWRNSFATESNSHLRRDPPCHRRRPSR